MHIFNSPLLPFLQLAIAMDMPGDVASMWSCINCRDAFRAVSVWTVDTIQRAVIVTTAKKDSTVIHLKPSHTKRHANVSRQFLFFRWYNFDTRNAQPLILELDIATKIDFSPSIGKWDRNRSLWHRSLTHSLALVLALRPLIKWIAIFRKNKNPSRKLPFQVFGFSKKIKNIMPAHFILGDCLSTCSISSCVYSMSANICVCSQHLGWAFLCYF